MKKIKLFRLILLLCVLGISSAQVTAQETPSDPTIDQLYPVGLPSFYVGVRGGYLFENKDLSENPAYYLKDGYHAELNLGWRSSKSWLGWQLNIGRLQLNRELSFEDSDVVGLNGYDVIQGSTPNWMWSETVRDDREFLYNNFVEAMDKTDLTSWYAMTGPEFWFGKDRLQAFVSLNAGVGMTKFGHYYRQSYGKSSNALEYTYYSQPNDRVLGPVNVTMDGRLQQHGMSQETFLAAGSPTDFSSVTIKDESELTFMAKGTVGIEYFLTERISLNASASYWYMMAPDWSSQSNSTGTIAFYGNNVPRDFKPTQEDPYVMLSPTGEEFIINGRTEYQSKEDFNNKHLGMLSANIGLRFWLGKGPSKNLVTNDDEVKPIEVAETGTKKSLLVTVTDEPTGQAISGVKVTVYKDGSEFYSGLSDINGALEEIKDLEPGVYEMVGILNGVETNFAKLDESDFEGNARIITRELLHNDLRFTLVGYTVNVDTNLPVNEAKTTLNNKISGQDTFQTTDNDGKFRFQLDPETDYNVYAEKMVYLSNREQVSTKGLDRSQTLYVDLRLGMNELKKGARIELRNIYYDYDKANIRTDAALVLDDLYKVLITNPTLVIELSSHTDSRGSDSYNLKLSQRRANSAVKYLIGKGIESSRLIAKGYGETRLANQCANGVTCPEDQHQANRRTEIEVIKE